MKESCISCQIVSCADRCIFGIMRTNERTVRISVRKGLIYDGELAPAVCRGGYFDALIDIATMI